MPQYGPTSMKQKRNKIKQIFKIIICFFSTHKWVDVTFLENSTCPGPTFRYCRRCGREEHRQIEGEYSSIASWRKI